MKLPRKKENTRIITFNKLVNAGKSSEKDILNLRIEDLKDLTDNVDIYRLKNYIIQKSINIIKINYPIK